MNQRLQLQEIAAHLRDWPALPVGTKVGTGYDRDYVSSFPKSFPAVWIGAQDGNATDDGDGWTGQMRQNVGVELAVFIVIGRYGDGQTNNEDELNVMHNAVCDGLLNWAPTGADISMRLVSWRDGAPNESLLTSRLIFKCEITYSKAL